MPDKVSLDGPDEVAATAAPRGNALSRRAALTTVALGAGAAALGAREALAQQNAPVSPPTTITNPPRDFGPETLNRR